MQINNPNSTKRHSRLGIASTILGGSLPFLVTGLFIFFMVSVEIGDDIRSKFLESLFGVSFYVFVFVALSAPVLHLTGLILGVIGAVSKETKKAFPITGIILNSTFGLIGVGLFYLLYLFLKYACCAFH